MSLVSLVIVNAVQRTDRVPQREKGWLQPIPAPCNERCRSFRRAARGPALKAVQVHLARVGLSNSGSGRAQWRQSASCAMALSIMFIRISRPWSGLGARAPAQSDGDPESRCQKQGEDKASFLPCALLIDSALYAQVSP